MKRRRTLIADIEALRAIPARWKQLKDPLAALDQIRNGEDWDLDEQLQKEVEDDSKNARASANPEPTFDKLA